MFGPAQFLAQTGTAGDCQTYRLSCAALPLAYRPSARQYLPDVAEAERLHPVNERIVTRDQVRKPNQLTGFERNLTSAKDILEDWSLQSTMSIK